MINAQTDTAYTMQWWSTLADEFLTHSAHCPLSEWSLSEQQQAHSALEE